MTNKVRTSAQSAGRRAGADAQAAAQAGARAEKAVRGFGVDESLPTRDRLVQAAIYLFYAKGYEATGMAELLTYAQANSGSFYHFFGSKEELLLEVLRWYQQNLEPVLIRPLYEQFPDPIERVFGLLEGYRQRILMTECTFGCPIGRLALEVAPERAEVHKLLATNFTGWWRAVEQCLRDAGERLPRDLDREQLAQFVLTVMEGGVMQSRAYRTVVPFDRAVAQLRDYFQRLEREAAHRGRRSRPGNLVSEKRKRRTS
jgi:AcrR family transcriptional regulator